MSNVIARRGFLRAMGATVIVAGGFNASRGETQQAVPVVVGNRTAKAEGAAERLRLPHAHLRQPLSGRAQRQAAAARCDRRRLSPACRSGIGTTRNVVVTPSTYGTDNSCTLDAMAKLGATAARRRGGRYERHRRRTQAAE